MCKTKWIAAMTVVLMGVGLTGYGQTVSDALEKAIYAEETVGDLDKAIALYRGIVEEADANRNYVAQALYRLGVCYEKAGNKEASHAALTRLLREFSNHTELAAAARKLLPPPPAKDQKYSDEDIRATDVQTFFDRMVKREPRYHGFAPMWALIEKGKQGDPETVKEIRAVASKIIKDSSRPLHQRWHSCYVLSGGGDGKAIPILAYALQKGEHEVLRGVAACALGAFDYAEAKTVLETALKTEQDNSVRESITKALAGEFLKGLSEEEKILLESDEVDAETLSAAGWKLWRERKLEEAELMFKKAVVKNPAAVDAWNGLGWAQSNQGKPLAARKSFQECLALEPEHAAALNGLGWIAKGEGEIETALEYWKRAVEAMPNATAALNGLTITLMDLGRYEEASEYYAKWLAAEPGNEGAASGLREALKKSGKPAPAPKKTSSAATGPIRWSLAGNNSAAYAMGADLEEQHEGAKVRFLKSTKTQSSGFGTMMTEVNAAPYRGKRVRLSAYVKSEDITDWAGLWMRIDGSAQEALGFDNMQDRAIKGTAAWTRHDVVLDVPEESAQIAFGILLSGTGRLWMTEQPLEVVGTDVPTTGMK